MTPTFPVDPAPVFQATPVRVRGMTASCLAPAKLNLSLRILGRRRDGWHDIRTEAALLDWGDMVSVRLTPSDGADRVRCPARSDLETPDNLALKLIRLLRQVAAIPFGVEVIIAKRIPVGAGLGGGSSDAAAVLRLLSLLMQRDFIMEIGLEPLARHVSADLPLFLSSGAKVAEGIGERIQPWSSPFSGRTALVAMPAFTFSTIRMYRLYDELKQPAGSTCEYLTEDALDSIKIHDMSGRNIYMTDETWNDFVPLACSRQPELVELLAMLHSYGALEYGMSGSGSAVFGLYSTHGAASAARRRLLARVAGLHAACGSFLP